MPTPRDPSKKEQPSTYVVQDRANKEELQRLVVQDTLMTTIMGGPLSEQSDAASLRRALDIGSGSGNWVLTTARTYPEMSLFGVDISQRMVEYARSQAASQQLDGRVEFHVMDALRKLEFPDEYFDLVNLRFGISFMRTWDWTPLLTEMLRVCRPGGIIRLTECEVGGQCSCPAVMQLYAMSVCALYRSGHLFEQTATGLIDHLPLLLTRHSCRQVQTRSYTPEIKAGTAEARSSIQDITYLYRTTRPFLEKWGCGSGDYDTIYQQALEQMQAPDFASSVTLLTTWGTKA
jgi:ubiquinone/menaquinone biosynthesis C-methylase UbiE